MSDEKKDSLEVKGPGGWGIKATGVHVAFGLAAIATAGLPVWAVLEHDRKTEVAHDIHQQQANEMVYILSLEPEERKKLNLSMPESLRKKSRRRPEE